MKPIQILTLLLALCLLLGGCGKEAEPQPEEVWAAKPSVMVDGVLYGTTGYSAPYRTDERPDRGGRVDGEITSTVEGHQYPTEDDQSNFGTGYPYRFGEEGTVEVFMEETDRWLIYEAYPEQ